jgi:sugar phosphate isomerase/epimerase
LAAVLEAYAGAGFRKFEGFTEWAEARFDVAAGPGGYLDLGRRHGMAFSSMHLPAVGGEDVAAALDHAVRAAEFARALGVKVVLFKAKSRELYIATGRAFLDRTEELGLARVVQNHVGTPITTLDDYRAVLAGIGDARMQALLEVGMFHSVGVSWREAYEALAGRIALVHVKDQVGDRRVPFGEGEIDLAGLFRRLRVDGYGGDVVIEMEVCRDDFARSVELLAAARRHCAGILAELDRDICGPMAQEA